MKVRLPVVRLISHTELSHVVIEIPGEFPFKGDADWRPFLDQIQAAGNALTAEQIEAMHHDVTFEDDHDDDWSVCDPADMEVWHPGRREFVVVCEVA